MKVSANNWARFEVPQENPPMKWLKQAVDQGDGMGFNGLHDEPVCCMDQTVSEPVRLRWPTFESMPVSVSKDLLKHLLNALQQTNMQRENLLAFFEAAGRGRISKRLPTMERYSFSAELATLLKQHHDRGHGNPLLETRDELLDADIPVQAAHSGRQRRGKANLPKRADVRWRSAAFAAWKQRNPKGGSAEFMAESRTWNDMSDAENILRCWSSLVTQHYLEKSEKTMRTLQIQSRDVSGLATMEDGLLLQRSSKWCKVLIADNNNLIYTCVPFYVTWAM